MEDEGGGAATGAEARYLLDVRTAHTSATPLTMVFTDYFS